MGAVKHSLKGPQAQSSHYGQLEIGLKLPELLILQEKADIQIFMWNLQVFKCRQLIHKEHKHRGGQPSLHHV